MNSEPRAPHPSASTSHAPQGQTSTSFIQLSSPQTSMSPVQPSSPQRSPQACFIHLIHLQLYIHTIRTFLQRRISRIYPVLHFFFHPYFYHQHHNPVFQPFEVLPHHSPTISQIIIVGLYVPALPSGNCGDSYHTIWTPKMHCRWPSALWTAYHIIGWLIMQHIEKQC